jgi:hypothetical protein
MYSKLLRIERRESACLAEYVHRECGTGICLAFRRDVFMAYNVIEVVTGYENF